MKSEGLEVKGGGSHRRSASKGHAVAVVQSNTGVHQSWTQTFSRGLDVGYGPLWASLYRQVGV